MDRDGAARGVDRPDPVGSVPSRRPTWWSWEPSHELPAIVVAAVVGVALVVLRRPSAVTDPGLYGEDGAVFLPDSLLVGLSAVFDPYNGYLHLIPRLIAAGAGLLPLAWTPLVYTLATAAVTVGCCAIVLSRRFAGLSAGLPERVVLFVLLLSMPRLTEVHLSLNSVLWYCGVALLLTGLADDPRSRAGRVAEVLGVPMLVLSGLAGVVLAPLAGLRWWRTRSRHSGVVAAAWWGSAAVQLVVYVAGDRDNGAFAGFRRLARAGLEKVFGSVFLGQRNVDGRWFTGAPRAVLILLAVLCIAWVAVVVSGMRWERSAVVLWAFGASLVSGFVALGPIAIARPGGFTLLPDRYSALPTAALLVGLVGSHPDPRLLRYLRLALLGVALVLRVTDFTVPARISIEWDQAVECLDVPDNSCLIHLQPPGWTVTIPAGVR